MRRSTLKVQSAQGQSVLISNQHHDRLTADLRDAGANLDAAQATHRAIPARLPPGLLT